MWEENQMKTFEEAGATNVNREEITEYYKRFANTWKQISCKL